MCDYSLEEPGQSAWSRRLILSRQTIYKGCEGRGWWSALRCWLNARAEDTIDFGNLRMDGQRDIDGMRNLGG